MGAMRDDAIGAMNAGHAGPGAYADIEANTLRRVTARLVPFLMICYVVAWLNRINLSFAALQMNRDLGLSASMYGLGAGLFFVTYCLCEIPSNLLLHRFGASRWIARIMLSWGVIAMASAFVRGPASFYVSRLLLGAAEAGFYPGVLYFMTLWFPQAHRGRVLGLFMAAIPITGIIGAPLSGALLGLDGRGGLQGWQWLYLVEGLPAVLLAPMVLAFVRDRPAKAPWLPEAERRWLEERLGRESRDVATARPITPLRAIADPMVLLLALTYFSNVCLINGITFFLPQIVHGLGFSALETGLIVAVPSVLALGALLWWGQRSDARRERVGHAALANLIGGLGLLAAMLTSDPILRIAAIAVSYACTLAFTAPFWAIPGAFLTAGSAASGIAAISAFGVTGGFVAPLVIGKLHDLTGDFRAGLGLDAAVSILVTLVFFIGGRGLGVTSRSRDVHPA
jgi:sugar phosphate permease